MSPLASLGGSGGSAPRLASHEPLCLLGQHRGHEVHSRCALAMQFTIVARGVANCEHSPVGYPVRMLALNHA
eukprot:6481791-Alexandrium_andersonii.AAC.1